MQICSVYATIVNFIRGLDSLLLILIFGALAIIGFLVLRKAIKVNYNAKNVDNLNLAWLLLAIVIFAVAIFMVVVYF
ncbi:MAG: hypothetical protein IJZ29_02880 [Clostridia bacterium]|nr:hypothetical protein [Clostridia bacterium]